MTYLYLEGATGVVALEVEQGVVVGPARDHKGQSTRSVNLRGALSYILDTPENLAQLGVDATRMLPAPKKRKGRTAKPKPNGQAGVEETA